MIGKLIKESERKTDRITGNEQKDIRKVECGNTECKAVQNRSASVTYRVIRSNRKTLALQISRDGELIVRAPQRMSTAQIEDFVRRSQGWIESKLGSFEKRQQDRHIITEEERSAGIAAAKRIFPQRVSFYAQNMGVTYGRITIREQKTRWGSCSSKGNLNFNWKLVLMPPEVLDYVVVHELAHRREMNHSAAFWRIVEQELPDYRQRRQMLREYGERLS